MTGCLAAPAPSGVCMVEASSGLCPGLRGYGVGGLRLIASFRVKNQARARRDPHFSPQMYFIIHLEENRD